MRVRILLISIALTLSLTHCASYDFARRVVKQGNMLPAKTVNRLKIGLSKNDTAMLLGTSLLSPVFNNNRWDYAYTYRRGNGALLIKHLTLYFSHDRLVRIERKP